MRHSQPPGRILTKRAIDASVKRAQRWDAGDSPHEWANHGEYDECMRCSMRSTWAGARERCNGGRPLSQEAQRKRESRKRQRMAEAAE